MEHCNVILRVMGLIAVQEGDVRVRSISKKNISLFNCP